MAEKQFIHTCSNFFVLKYREFRYYWKHVLQGEPVYGADSPGTICDENLREFNMNHLGTVLDMLDDSGVSNFNFSKIIVQ